MAYSAAMLEELLQLNGRAAEQGHFDVAYHLLMAALHFADHSRDVAALNVIARLAREQGQALERIKPPHALSRAHAQHRGQTALFDSFAAHIEAVRLRLQSEEHRHKRPPLA
jgi:histidinol phosphatase-like PHP family hydrolase